MANDNEMVAEKVTTAIVPPKLWRIVEMRLRGHSIIEIAQELYGGDATLAAVDLWKALQSHNIPTDEERKLLQLLRLDEYRRSLWPAVKLGNEKAILVCLKVDEREALLLGLDAPTKVDIAERVREIAERAGLDPVRAVKAVEAHLARIKIIS